MKCPRIKFLGLLDTVKRVNNGVDSTARSLRFHDSIENVRHALALNETRTLFKPELYDYITNNLAEGRSLIQAWFVGAHADIGGGAKNDGLSLYPLQWLLVESRHYGLILEREPQTAPMEDPQALVFPSPNQETFTYDRAAADNLWVYEYANGIRVQMQDLRPSHGHVYIQSLTIRSNKKRHSFSSPKRSKAVADASSSIRHPITAANDFDIEHGHAESDTRRGKRSLVRRMFGKKQSAEASSKLTSSISTKAPQNLNKIVESNGGEPMRHLVRLNPGFPHVAFQSYRTPFRDGKLQGYVTSEHGTKANLSERSTHD